MASNTIKRIKDNGAKWYRYPNFMTVIIGLCHSHKRTISVFARKIGKRYGNILDIVNFLIERGFLEKRKRTLYVTERGQKLSYDLNKVGMDLF